MTGNDELLEERHLIYDLLGTVDSLEITDTGLGMGEADLCYERVIPVSYGLSPRRRVSVTIRIEEP